MDVLRLKSAIDYISGEGNWAVPEQWGGFLVKFPDSIFSQWRVPSGYWHMDFHYTYDPDQIFGIRVFSFLSDIVSIGGSTLVVEKSHQLVKKFVKGQPEEHLLNKMGTLRDEFNSSSDWLRRLTDANDSSSDRNDFFIMRSTVIDGVEVTVRELLGEAGYVYRTHPWLVHSASGNAGKIPLFIRAKDLHRSDGAGDNNF